MFAIIFAKRSSQCDSIAVPKKEDDVHYKGFTLLANLGAGRKKSGRSESNRCARFWLNLM